MENYPINIKQSVIKTVSAYISAYIVILKNDLIKEKNILHSITTSALRLINYLVLEKITPPEQEPLDIFDKLIKFVTFCLRDQKATDQLILLFIHSLLDLVSELKQQENNKKTTKKIRELEISIRNNLKRLPGTKTTRENLTLKIAIADQYRAANSKDQAIEINPVSDKKPSSKLELKIIAGLTACSFLIKQVQNKTVKKICSDTISSITYITKISKLHNKDELLLENAPPNPETSKDYGQLARTIDKQLFIINIFIDKIYSWEKNNLLILLKLLEKRILIAQQNDDILKFTYELMNCALSIKTMRENTVDTSLHNHIINIFNNLIQWATIKKNERISWLLKFCLVDIINNIADRFIENDKTKDITAMIIFKKSKNFDRSKEMALHLLDYTKFLILRTTLKFKTCYPEEWHEHAFKFYMLLFRDGFIFPNFQGMDDATKIKYRKFMLQTMHIMSQIIKKLQIKKLQIKKTISRYLTQTEHKPLTIPNLSWGKTFTPCKLSITIANLACNGDAKELSRYELYVLNQFHPLSWLVLSLSTQQDKSLYEHTLLLFGCKIITEGKQLFAKESIAAACKLAAQFITTMYQDKKNQPLALLWKNLVTESYSINSLINITGEYINNPAIDPEKISMAYDIANRLLYLCELSVQPNDKTNITKIKNLRMQLLRATEICPKELNGYGLPYDDSQHGISRYLIRKLESTFQFLIDDDKPQQQKIWQPLRKDANCYLKLFKEYLSIHEIIGKYFSKPIIFSEWQINVTNPYFKIIYDHSHNECLKLYKKNNITILLSLHPNNASCFVYYKDEYIKIKDPLKQQIYDQECQLINFNHAVILRALEYLIAPDYYTDMRIWNLIHNDPRASHKLIYTFNRKLPFITQFDYIHKLHDTLYKEPIYFIAYKNHNSTTPQPFAGIIFDKTLFLINHYTAKDFTSYHRSIKRNYAIKIISLSCDIANSSAQNNNIPVCIELLMVCTKYSLKELTAAKTIILPCNLEEIQQRQNSSIESSYKTVGMPPIQDVMLQLHTKNTSWNRVIKSDSFKQLQKLVIARKIHDMPAIIYSFFKYIQNDDYTFELSALKNYIDFLEKLHQIKDANLQSLRDLTEGINNFKLENFVTKLKLIIYINLIRLAAKNKNSSDKYLINIAKRLLRFKTGKYSLLYGINISQLNEIVLFLSQNDAVDPPMLRMIIEYLLDLTLKTNDPNLLHLIKKNFMILIYMLDQDIYIKREFLNIKPPLEIYKQALSILKNIDPANTSYQEPLKLFYKRHLLIAHTATILKASLPASYQNAHIAPAIAAAKKLYSEKAESSAAILDNLKSNFSTIIKPNNPAIKSFAVNRPEIMDPSLEKMATNNEITLTPNIIAILNYYSSILLDYYIDLKSEHLRPVNKDIIHKLSKLKNIIYLVCKNNKQHVFVKYIALYMAHITYKGLKTTKRLNYIASHTQQITLNTDCKDFQTLLLNYITYKSKDTALSAKNCISIQKAILECITLHNTIHSMQHIFKALKKEFNLHKTFNHDILTEYFIIKPHDISYNDRHSKKLWIYFIKKSTTVIITTGKRETWRMQLKDDSLSNAAIYFRDYGPNFPHPHLAICIPMESNYNYHRTILYWAQLIAIFCLGWKPKDIEIRMSHVNPKLTTELINSYNYVYNQLISWLADSPAYFPSCDHIVKDLDLESVSPTYDDSCSSPSLTAT